MRFRYFTMAALVLAPAAATAQDWQMPSGYGVQNLVTVPDLTTSAGVPTGQNNQRYSTVFGTANNGAYDFGTKGMSNFDGVVQLLITQSAGTFACTGALLAGGTQVLTAAHCVTAGSGANAAISVSFRGYNSGGSLVTLGSEAGSQVRIATGYTGSVVDERDVAVINLTNALPSWVTQYSVGFGLDPMGKEVVLSGYGRTGNGTTGDNLSNTGNVRRAGLNRFDATRNATTISPLNSSFGILWGDFDNGTTGSDRTCNIFGGPSGSYFTSFPQYKTQLCNTGVGDPLMEVGIGRGDSGGGAFLNGQIVGVASFGESISCPSTTTCVGAFGRGFGYTNITSGPASDWLLQTVPEPSTYALLGTGLLAVFGFGRRRRNS